MKRKNFKVERTDGDDILDALSMRINQNLRTEKQIDDKKNNVYFWLFKFLILIVYLLILNGIFYLVKELGVYLIYLFAVSLRSVLSFIFDFGITFIQLILTTYILLKNLKIFTRSTYYKKLYSKDRYMLKKKREFFGIIEKILQAFGVVYLVVIGFIAIFLVSLLTMFVALMMHKLYMFSLFAIVIILLILCFFVFGEMKSKFFGYRSHIRKEHLYIGLLALAFSIICFGYETSTYKMNSNLPDTMDTVKNGLTIDISEIEKVEVSSNAKFNNVEVVLDSTLDDMIRVEVEYFETANVSYTSYFNDNNVLKLQFDGDIDFKFENLKDVYRLGVETVRTKTMYNYNMFKYPIVRIYVGLNDYDRIKVEGSTNNLE